MKNKEGDIYKSLEIEGVSFEIRYGYYDPELERGRIEPMPIFPNFEDDPQYTKKGYMFITADQAICKHFEPKSRESDEGWCNDCKHLELYESCLGVCRCENNRKRE